MTNRDHKIEMWTVHDEKVEDMVTEEEARQLEAEPFREGSGIASTRVTPPPGEVR